MKYLIFLATVIAATTAMSVKMAPLLADDSDTAIDGKYIVVFTNNVTDEIVRRHHATIAQEMLYFKEEENKLRHTYKIRSFRGYSAKLNDKLRDKIRLMPEVKYVERVQEARILDGKAFCLDDTRDLSWGLARTSQDKQYSRGDPYIFDEECTGEGVDVYVIDTGTDNTLATFGGRAEFGADCVGDPADCGGSVEGDLNGHGTHVTGTVISDVYGLARGATARSVRVLDAGGSGTFEDVIAGVNWVTNNQRPGRHSIINMSLGGGSTPALNDAVENAKRNGVHVVVAAGNEATDACTRSPAGAGIITVGATDISDVFAYFSNYGRCVDLLGPGVDIVAEAPGGGTNTYSGTSMASPHVAGVLAKYLTNGICRDSSSSDPEPMEEYLARKAVNDAISGVPSDTPNLLINMKCEE